MYSKKGISAVVVTIMIVLVAIVAVAIFWAALRGQVEGGSESIDIQGQCISLDLQISEIDSNANTVTVERKPGKADGFSGIKVVVDGTSEDCEETPGELENVDCSVEVEEDNEVEIYGVIGDTICSSPADSKIA